MRDTRLSPDQAEALAELNSSRPVKVIAVTGGKGGVGKTTVSANLAVSIAAQGRDVMLVDADLGAGQRRRASGPAHAVTIWVT